MENGSFKKAVKFRKQFMEQRKEDDFVCEIKNSNILISMPHAVPQTRLGKHKHEEPGTIFLGLKLAEELNASYIIKTRNNFDDANFDENSNYKEKIKYLIEACGIEYIIDVHGLNWKRECDLNLGINFGKNIKNNEKLYENLQNNLKKENFLISIDSPFKAGERTIAGYFAANFNVWAVQLEVNNRITNKSNGFKREVELIEVLKNTFKKFLK